MHVFFRNTVYFFERYVRTVCYLSVYTRDLEPCRVFSIVAMTSIGSRFVWYRVVRGMAGRVECWLDVDEGQRRWQLLLPRHVCRQDGRLWRWTTHWWGQRSAGPAINVRRRNYRYHTTTTTTTTAMIMMMIMNKCCGFISSSASVISPSVVKIGQWLYLYE